MIFGRRLIEGPNTVETKEYIIGNIEGTPFELLYTEYYLGRKVIRFTGTRKDYFAKGKQIFSYNFRKGTDVYIEPLMQF